MLVSVSSISHGVHDMHEIDFCAQMSRLGTGIRYMGASLGTTINLNICLKMNKSSF